MVGAGVVGLACARELALRGREVLVVEAADGIGTENSSRNSEVVHAGIYYAKGSLKARLCVAGRDLLYDYCRSRGIPHRRLGKLIVATEEAEVSQLTSLEARGEANGVADLELLDRGETLRLEPALRAVAALHSPSTGIVDSHALMLAFRGEAEDAGAMLAFRCPVLGGAAGDAGIVLECGGREPMRLACRFAVNAAGLGAQRLAASLAGLARDTIPTLRLAKGNYFTLGGRSPFTRLIYPVPGGSAGLGVHLTLDMAGRARFGPDVEWVERIDYDVDPGRGRAFYAAIRTYWPGLADGALIPGYSGIRPKIQAPGAAAADFVIQGEAVHGVKGLVNLYGIESPGLTSALAIASAVADMAD